MTTTPQRHSATIYQFPVGGARGLEGWKARIEAKPDAVMTPVVIDSWYHEDTMRDTKPQ